MSDTMQQTILNKAVIDKFILVLDLPKRLKNIETHSTRSKNLVNLDKLQFSVNGVLVPPVTVPAESLGTYGQTYRVSSHSRPDYPPIKVSFLIDNNFDNYWILWKWLEVLNKPKESGIDKDFAKVSGVKNVLDNLNSRDIEYRNLQREIPHSDYQTDITIYGLREYNEQIIKFRYIDAFITSLGEIPYDYKSNSEIPCYFEFVFNQLEIDLIDP